MKVGEVFGRFARWISNVTGRPWTFLLAVMIIVVWAITGPLFHFSDTWQLVINTGTTVVTFLMVFLIQSTQYHDSEAIQIKLDELIRAVEGAHNMVVNLEDATQQDLERIQANYQDLARRAKLAMELGEEDTGNPEVNLPPPQPGPEDNSHPNGKHQKGK